MRGTGYMGLDRPSWDEYFMALAEVVSRRATCVRRGVGALLVRDRRILATGYNGAPTGLQHCGQAGCMREEMNVPSGQRHELCRGLHAEQNAIIQAALHGTSVRDSVLYVTHQPCVVCAKMLVNAQIKEIVFAGEYPDELSRYILEEAGINLRRVSNEGGRE